MKDYHDRYEQTRDGRIHRKREHKDGRQDVRVQVGTIEVKAKAEVVDVSIPATAHPNQIGMKTTIEGGQA
jgi:hypothetical protein